MTSTTTKTTKPSATTYENRNNVSAFAQHRLGCPILPIYAKDYADLYGTDNHYWMNEASVNKVLLSLPSYGDPYVTKIDKHITYEDLRAVVEGGIEAVPDNHYFAMPGTNKKWRIASDMLNDPNSVTYCNGEGMYEKPINLHLRVVNSKAAVEHFHQDKYDDVYGNISVKISARRFKGYMKTYGLDIKSMYKKTPTIRQGGRRGKRTPKWAIAARSGWYK